MIVEIPRSEVLPLLGLDSVFACEVVSAEGRDRAWYFDGLPLEMEPPPATLRVIQEDNAKHGKVTVCTDHYARVVTLEADVDFDDNYFELLPGETRTVEWKNPAGEHLPGPVVVTCWNDARGVFSTGVSPG